MPPDLPLAGVRVLDLSWIIAGPTATRFLAMMGAKVIKIDSVRRPDPSSRGAPFQTYNQSKRYAALNTAQPEGLALAKRLLALADVLVENFAAGVVERLLSRTAPPPARGSTSIASWPRPSAPPSRRLCSMTR